jgi:hypothetical protein
VLTRILVQLEIEGDPTDAYDVVDAVLDAGQFQDAINEHDLEGCGPLRVVVAAVLGLDECADCGASTGPEAPSPHECSPTPPASLLTADTITDEQIRELSEDLCASGSVDTQETEEIRWALIQINSADPDAEARLCRKEAARVRCAQIINARRSA